MNLCLVEHFSPHFLTGFFLCAQQTGNVNLFLISTKILKSVSYSHLYYIYQPTINIELKLNLDIGHIHALITHSMQMLYVQGCRKWGSMGGRARSSPDFGPTLTTPPPLPKFWPNVTTCSLPLQIFIPCDIPEMYTTFTRLTPQSRAI